MYIYIYVYIYVYMYISPYKTFTSQFHLQLDVDLLQRRGGDSVDPSHGQINLRGEAGHHRGELLRRRLWKTGNIYDLYMENIWKIYGRCAKIMKDMEDRWKNRWEKLRTQPSLVISIRLCYEFYSPRSLLDFRLKFRDDHQNPPNPVEYICIQVPLSRGSEKEDKVRGYTWHNRRHSFVQTSGCSLN